MTSSRSAISGSTPPRQAAGALLPVDSGQATSAAADPGSLTLEVWGGAGGRVAVHEQRGTTGAVMTVSAGNAEVTTTGPASPGRLEWPRIAGAEPPRRVIVNGRAWTLDERDADRLVAVPD